MSTYADLNDINTHLPTDKIPATEGNEEVDRIVIDVGRLIRGQLAGTYEPATIAAWTEPGDTPELIRGISGRLVAAFYYRLRYSEDTEAVPEYAQRLYDEAMAMLTAIRSGDLIITELPQDDSGRVPNRLAFWPNDDTPERAFTMGQQF